MRAKLVCTDEIRRTREEMGADLYNRLGYFEKGIESLRRLLMEKGLIDQQEGSVEWPRLPSGSRRRDGD